MNTQEEYTGMAVISTLYTIIVSMHYLGMQLYKPSHIHVKYQEYEAVLSMPEDAVLDGSIPTGKLKLVQAWIEIFKDDLAADRELASSGQTVFTIDPLK